MSLPSSHALHRVEDLLARLNVVGPLQAVLRDRSALVRPGARWGLTGATGGWGRAFARALLHHDPAARLIVPVRGDAPSAHARLIRAWAPTAVWRAQALAERWWERTTVVPLDDLTELSAASSIGRLDTVVHAAAELSLAAPFERSWHANVEGTRAAWRWARRHHAERFDHVSTLSVFVAGGAPAGSLFEDDPLTQATVLSGGYAASKWAAEAWLTDEAGRLGAKAPALAVHRLGLIAPAADESPSEGLAAVARAWAKWGRPGWAQAVGGEAMDLTPVGRSVDRMLAIAAAGGTGAFHAAAQTPITGSALLAALSQAFGDRSGRWPSGDPLARHAQRALQRWADPVRHAQAPWHDLFQSTHHRYDATHAHDLDGQRWQADEGLVERLSELSRESR